MFCKFCRKVYVHDRTLGKFIHDKTLGKFIHDRTLGKFIHDRTLGKFIHDRTLGKFIHDRTLGKFILLTCSVADRKLNKSDPVPRFWLTRIRVLGSRVTRQNVLGFSLDFLWQYGILNKLMVVSGSATLTRCTNQCCGSGSSWIRNFFPGSRIIVPDPDTAQNERADL